MQFSSLQTSRKALLAASAAAIAIFAASSATAQDSDNIAPVSAPVEPTTSDGDIVVTARRRDERLRDVPVAINAIQPADIQRLNLTQFSDIKLAAPQVSFDRAFSASGASVALRGISSSNLDAGLDQSVLLSIDGMPVSRGRIFSDALFDLDGIEVLKGPQALFFGKNAPAGVVSVRSAGPTATWSGYARTGYEVTARQALFEGAIGGPITPDLGIRVAVYGSTSDGYLHNDSRGISITSGGRKLFVPPAQSRLGGEKKLAGRLTLVYQPQNALKITLKVLGSYYDGQGLSSLLETMSCTGGATRPTSFGLVDPYGDCTLNNHTSIGWIPPEFVTPYTQLNRFAKTEPDSYNKSILPVLTAEYKFGDVNLTSVSGFYHYSFGNTGNQDATAYSQLFSFSNEFNTSFFQEVRATTTFDSPLNFAAGGYYENNKRTYLVGSIITYLAPDPATGRGENSDFSMRNKGHAWSVFGQATWKIVPSVELAAGARYTKENKSVDLSSTYVHPLRLANFLPVGTHLIGERTEDNVSPEATITWKADRDLTLYGAYKTGYLSGGFSNPGNISRALTIERDTFGAVKAKGFESGAKFELFGRMSGSLTAYSYRFDGLQLTSYDVPSNTFFTKNAASTRTKGVELEGQYRISSDFRLRGSASYNQARFLSFPDGQCYINQTAAQGCVTVPGTATKTQDLRGRPLYRAPTWLFTFGGSYDTPVADNLKFGVSADVRTTSGYYSSLNLNPGSYQKRYAMLNGATKIGSIDDRWTFSVIGKNLTDRHYATISLDKPGGAGEVETVASEPRTVLFQIGTKF